MYPDAAYNQALLNLKAACCADEKLPSDQTVCTQDEDFFPAVFPQSYHLYDHLIDIALRRLDAVDGAYGLEYDARSLEWREFISKEVGESTEANFARSMEKEFADSWEEIDDYTLQFASWEALDDFERRDVVNKDVDYMKANVYHRYKETCGIAAQIYFNVSRDAQTNVAAEISNRGFAACKKMVDARIADETAYAKTLIQQKSTELLWKSTNAYMTEYFAKNRLMNLKDTVMTISDLFMTIAKGAPEGTFQCN